MYSSYRHTESPHTHEYIFTANPPWIKLFLRVSPVRQHIRARLPNKQNKQTSWRPFCVRTLPSLHWPELTRPRGLQETAESFSLHVLTQLVRCSTCGREEAPRSLKNSTNRHLYPCHQLFERVKHIQLTHRNPFTLTGSSSEQREQDCRFVFQR